MKPPAKTLADAKLVLDRERPELNPLLPADKALYVQRDAETYNDLITEALSAVASQRPFRWFFTGHTGAGKSTELNRIIAAEDLVQHYVPRIYMRRALAIFMASLGAEHPSTRIVQGNYAHLLEAQGRTDEDVRAALDELQGGQD